MPNQEIRIISEWKKTLASKGKGMMNQEDLPRFEVVILRMVGGKRTSQTCHVSSRQLGTLRGH